jgi:hypothetical protein
MYNETCTKCKPDETGDFCGPENTGYKKNVIPPVIRQTVQCGNVKQRQGNSATALLISFPIPSEGI